MLTALEVLKDRGVVATNAMNRRRDAIEGRTERNAVDMKSYRNGEAIAYIDSAKIMEAELRRLCNKFQNGNLSVDDFGVVL